MSERPAAVQKYVVEIAALQGEGTGQQDPEVPMDQSGSHVSSSKVSSSSRSTRSGTKYGTREVAHAAMELEAVQSYPYAIDSETPSEQEYRQAREAEYIGSPETVQGDNGEEDEYTGEEHSDDENGGEGETSQATKMKETEPGGGELKGRGVDG